MVSLGCPKNLVDAEVMLGHLREAGYRIVNEVSAADTIVVNTCGFIDQAKQESVNAVLEAARERRAGRLRRLVVTGCLAHRYETELRCEIPEIDATLGTGQPAGIVAAVSGEPTCCQRSRRGFLADRTSPRMLSTPPFTAYVKISEGCNHVCSFCVIPRLRGRYRSRPLEDVVAEVQCLAERGVKEINLVAQDTTLYGRDLGLRDGLAALLHRLAGIDRVRWIRVLYAYPTTVSDAILEAMAGEDKVVKYLDMPLQHVSVPVLRRMRRPTGKGQRLGMVERVRRQVPGISLRTSFIVGFPGETEDDFAQLRACLDAIEFDHVGVFAYSDEDGTAAFSLPDRVPPRVKQLRRRQLLRVQQRVSARRNRRRIGERVEVLVEGTHPETRLLLKGRLSTQAPEIDGAVLINDGAAAAGSFVTCEVTEAHPYDLVARIV